MKKYILMTKEYSVKKYFNIGAVFGKGFALLVKLSFGICCTAQSCPYTG